MYEKETCKAHILDLATYGDIVNIENGNSYREWLFRCNASYGAADDFSHFVLPCIQMWYVRQELQKRLFSMDRSHSDASKRHSCITVRLARSEADCMGSR